MNFIISQYLICILLYVVVLLSLIIYLRVDFILFIISIEFIFFILISNILFLGFYTNSTQLIALSLVLITTTAIDS